jgi:hypothetical protein
MQKIKSKTENKIEKYQNKKRGQQPTGPTRDKIAQASLAD